MTNTNNTASLRRFRANLKPGDVVRHSLHADKPVSVKGRPEAVAGGTIVYVEMDLPVCKGYGWYSNVDYLHPAVR